jgi:hypothetical protein
VAVITTLLDAGPYEAGAGALLNSLTRSGFQGTVYCGVRGAPTGCLQSLPPLDGIDVRVTAVDTELHLSSYKPRFLLEMLRDHASEVGLHMDPDIVVTCSWGEIEEWYGGGIAAAANAIWIMPASSPIRDDWLEFREILGVPLMAGEQLGQIDVYCNSGFVAVHPKDRAFLELWAALLDAVITQDLAGHYALAGRPLGHPWPDQDLFNISLMNFAERTAIKGPEAMGFAPGRMLLGHAIASPKPWDTPAIRRALLGMRPTVATREFLRFADVPIRVLSSAKRTRRAAAWRMANGIGKIWARDDY